MSCWTTGTSAQTKDKMALIATEEEEKKKNSSAKVSPYKEHLMLGTMGRYEEAERKKRPSKAAGEADQTVETRWQLFETAKKKKKLRHVVNSGWHSDDKLMWRCQKEWCLEGNEALTNLIKMFYLTGGWFWTHPKPHTSLRFGQPASLQTPTLSSVRQHGALF